MKEVLRGLSIAVGRLLAWLARPLLPSGHVRSR